MNVTEQVLAEQFEKSCRETVLHCEERKSEIAESFLQACFRLIEQAVNKGEEGNDNKAKYLLFSCLHSSIFLKKYFIHIDLMGQGFYSDTPLASMSWDAGDIYCFFERDIEEISRKVRENVPRLRVYEVDYIRYAYAPYYHGLVKEFIREMLSEILEGSGESEEKRKKEAQVKILFGEYMGEADLLLTVDRERLYEIFQNLCR